MGSEVGKQLGKGYLHPPTLSLLTWLLGPSCRWPGDAHSVPAKDSLGQTWGFLPGMGSPHLPMGTLPLMVVAVHSRSLATPRLI